MRARLRLAALLIPLALLACGRDPTSAPTEPGGAGPGRADPGSAGDPGELIEAGRFAEAERRIRALMSAAPGASPASPAGRDATPGRLPHLLALALSGQGRFDEALAAIVEADRAAGSNPEVQRAYASVLLKSGRAREAVERYRKAIELAERFRRERGLPVPDLHRWRYEYAQALRRAGDAAEADRELEIYRRAQEEEIELRSLARRAGNEGTADAYSSYGKALRLAGKWSETMAALEAALAADADHAPALLAMTSVLLDRARVEARPPERARLLDLAEARVARANEISETYDGHLMRAWVARLRGEPGLGEDSVSRALELAPGDADLLRAIEVLRSVPPGEAR